MCDLSEILLGCTPSQRIVAELHGSAVRTYHPPEHTAGCPLVEPSHVRNRMPYPILPFHSSAVMPYRILPWLSELAEDKVPLVIIVVDALRILQQPSSGTVPSVLPLRRAVEVSHEVRHAVYHVRSGALCGLLAYQEVKAVVVVAHDRSRQLVLLREQPVCHAPFISPCASLDASRAHGFPCLTSEAVPFGADGDSA